MGHTNTYVPEARDSCRLRFGVVRIRRLAGGGVFALDLVWEASLDMTKSEMPGGLARGGGLCLGG